MGVSIRAYARHRGVAHNAVRKAIKTGRIQVNKDKTIDVTQADLDWKQNTNPAKAGSVKTGSAGRKLLKTGRVTVEPEGMIDLNEAIAHVFRSAWKEYDACLTWPSRVSAQMATELQVDAQHLQVLLEAHMREFLSEFDPRTIKEEGALALKGAEIPAGTKPLIEPQPKKTFFMHFLKTLRTLWGLVFRGNFRKENNK